MNYQYDAWDRIVSIPGFVEGLNIEGSQEIMPGIAYDRSGFMQSIRYANGVETIYNPDSRGRLQSILVNDHSSLDLCYTYDGNNNIISVNDIQYQYHSFDRLVEVVQGNETTNFSYDRQGNRKQLIKTVNGQKIVDDFYSYLPYNRLDNILGSSRIG